MNVRSTTVRLAVVIAITTSFVAVQSETSDAVVYSVASCSGMKASGYAKSTVTGQGYTDIDNRDTTISIRGVDPNVKYGANLGSCFFSSGLSTADSATPPLKGYSGFKNLLKWGAKFFSTEADCDTTDTGDTTEGPLNGKISMQFTDLNGSGKNNKLDAYVAIDGPTDPDNDPLTPSDVVSLHGMVTKGVAAGSDVQGELYLTPVLKDPSQLTATPHFGYQMDIFPLIGCTTATQGDTNIVSVVMGNDNFGVSQVLALPVASLQFTIGTP